MRYKDGTHELYDMKNDPGEFTNLAESRNFEPRMKQLEEILQTRLDQAGIRQKNSSTKQRQAEQAENKPAPGSK